MRYGSHSISLPDSLINVIPGGEERGTVADALRRLYWDTALSYRDPILRMLRNVVGLDQVTSISGYQIEQSR
jgi:hypothetical protein